MFNFDKLKEQLKQTASQKSSYYNDENEWKLAKDKQGNGNAVIRFLPNKDPEDLPVVKIFEYNIWIKNPITNKKRAYTEKSLATLNKPDPVSEAYFLLNGSEVKEYKELAENIKRDKKYVSNIYVVKDPLNPDNEGKVFYYKFGQKIMDKIMMQIEPSENLVASGVQPINVFDPINGANFNIIFTKTQYTGNYDASFFTPPSALFPDMSEEMVYEWIKQNCFDLKEKFLSPETFKSYEELKKKFHYVVSGTEIEKALIELGFFDKPYDEPGNPNKRKVTSVQTPTQVSQTPTQVVQEPTQVVQKPTQVVQEPTQVVQKPTSATTKTQTDSSSDEIDELLDDILGD